jgi:LacI family transcriptional regulator
MSTVQYDSAKPLDGNGKPQPGLQPAGSWSDRPGRPEIDGAALSKATTSIVTVAKKAGVSVATVSRVLNDLPNVRPETAKQVRAAIEQIGYTPPRVKRGPKTGTSRVAGGGSRVRTGQIAVLTLGSGQHWLELPVMAAVLSGISGGAKELGLGLLLDAMPDVSALSPVIRRRQVAGAIVFLQSRVPPESLINVRKHMPLVWAMGAEGGAPDVDHISADNVGIGYLAYQYLTDSRCQQLAFISADPSWHIMRLRGQSFANAARDAERTVTSYLVGNDPLVVGAYGRDVVTAESLDKLVDKLVAAKPRPNGLFVPTDLLTTRVYPLLLERGVKPGRDITIISCDNEEVRLSALNPRPASIDIRPEDIGRRAVRRLLMRLENADEPAARIQVAPRLVLPA